MAKIHASMIGAAIISKEERDKTTEFLFAKPVSRNEIITAKLFSGFANILIFNLITTTSSIIMVDIPTKVKQLQAKSRKIHLWFFVDITGFNDNLLFAICLC